MEQSVDPSFLKLALIVLGAAGVVIPLFHRRRVSPVLGFMIVGAAVGPFGLGRLVPHFPWLGSITIHHPEAIAPVAEFGVVLLMFMIGLELSFERLWLMRRLVFGLGTLQVLACSALLTGALLLFGTPLAAAVVLGVAGSMSSTAVVLQVLGESKRIGAPLGRTCFGILLFQDIAVLPVMFVLGMLGPGGDSGEPGTLWRVAGQTIVAVVGIVAFGRLALRPLFRSVARTRSPELFMAASLLVVLAAALATAAAGLSMALGALIGGLLLAGTEFRRQVEVTIEPFKGLLVGVFLISVGMGLDLGHVAAAPGLILGMAGGLVTLKLVAVVLLTRALGLSWSTGLQAGLLLGPAGEFSFVILAAELADGLLSPALAKDALAVAALTMAAIPLLAQFGQRLERRAGVPREIDPALLGPVPASDAPRVIIAGFGRVGQTVASLLEAHRIAYVAIDRDPDRVARERAAGRAVYYGDMTQTALLERLELPHARALVITIDERAVADSLVAAARAERPDLLIVARARDASHAAHLYRAGASDAVPETVEASLQLSEAVLVDLGVAMGPAIASIHEKRAAIQASIKAMAPQAEIRPLGRRRLRDAKPAEVPSGAR
jgi:CPA2 family monovalent cation:H+ antiporter-2